MSSEIDTDQTSTAQGCCLDQISEAEMADRIEDVIDQFSGVNGALIPVLQSAQNMFGYLPEEVLKRISLKLRIPYSEVAGVVSFYSYFSTVPRGRHIVRVCLGTACYVRGGKEVLQAIQDFLGIDVGYTTEDRIFSLEVGRCYGACGLAPVVMIDDQVYQRVKPSRIRDMLTPYKVSEPCGEEA
jgi:NADH:ubiquinone oxidoreductase subunit E